MLAAAKKDIEGQPAQELPPALAAALTRHIADGTLDLPVLAEAAQRVMQMALDEDVEAAAFADVIKRDSALASHLLRVANSPLYRARAAIVSLQQAVSRLGMRQVREIAMAIVCESRVFRVRGYEKELKEMFRHSLATGYFAQEIARAKRSNVEEAFLGGLLHDIGRPVLLQTVVDLERELRCRAPRLASLDAVSEAHARVGASLVTRWELPAKLAEAVMHHHRQEVPGAGAPLFALIGIADQLAHLAMDPDPAEASEAALRGSPLLAAVNLYPEELDVFLGTRDKVRAAVEALG
jgi:putative nucleotidyltransferase with HDIG domain